MRKVKPSTQAMVELQQLLRTIATYELQLHRTGKFWELWHVGDDFGMGEAEKAKLFEEVDEDTMVYLSSKIVSFKITPNGAIRGIDFEHGRYKSASVLHQFIMLLEAIELDGYVIDVTVDMRPNGQLIDVDVIAIEDNSGYTGVDDDTFVEQRFERVVGRFAYDPAKKLLLHRG